VSLPSGAWVSGSLATALAITLTAVRLHQRRRARLSWPIATSTDPAPTPTPTSLGPAEAEGSRDLDYDASNLPGVVPGPPPTPTAVGIDDHGREISLFEIAPAGISLTGPGAEPAVRAMVAAALSTAVLGNMVDQPIVLTTTAILVRLLPIASSRPASTPTTARSMASGSSSRPPPTTRSPGSSPR